MTRDEYAAQLASLVHEVAYWTTRIQEAQQHLAAAEAGLKVLEEERDGNLS